MCVNILIRKSLITSALMEIITNLHCALLFSLEIIDIDVRTNGFSHNYLPSVAILNKKQAPVRDRCLPYFANIISNDNAKLNIISGQTRKISQRLCIILRNVSKSHYVGRPHIITGLRTV